MKSAEERNLMESPVSGSGHICLNVSYHMLQCQRHYLV